MTQSFKNTAIALAAFFVVILSVFMLERSRAGLEISDFNAGTTPVTSYQESDSDRPVVLVAHGFASSRQIMQAYSLLPARSGYRVLAFDFEGHGRNPRPMSGDVAAVDGTTALLVAETRAGIDAARGLQRAGPVSLPGHSMATDIIIRAAMAERQRSAIGAPELQIWRTGKKRPDKGIGKMPSVRSFRANGTQSVAVCSACLDGLAKRGSRPG